MIGQAGIENFPYLFVSCEEFSDYAAAAIVLFHAHGQGFNSAQHQPAFEGRKDRSRDFLYESQLLGLFRAGADHDAPEAVAVAVKEFGGRMDDHIRSQSNRLLEIWRHESVVYNQLDFLAAANFADGLKIGESHEWVGWRLYINHPRLFANGALDISDVRSVHVSELDAVAGENLVEETRRSSVEIIAADDVVARLVHGAESCDGGHTAGEDTRRDSTFQGSEILFQTCARRIRNSRIFVPFVFSNLLLDVGRGRMDGGRDSAAFEVRLLSDVNGASCKTGRLIFVHDGVKNKHLAISTQHSALKHFSAGNNRCLCRGSVKFAFDQILKV
jgi:hypothetical protein